MALLENLDFEDEAPPRPVAVPAPPHMAQWARFRDGFADSMGDGFWTIDDLEAKVRRGEAFFFPGAESAIVGKITIYPGGEQAFHIIWATGDAAEVVGLEPGVASVARMMGCTAMLWESRPAWKKLLAPLGYKLRSVILERGL